MSEPDKLTSAHASVRSRPTSPKLIVGDGEMAEQIRDYPWEDSPLGPVETWPSTLLTSVNLILNSPTAMEIYWGPEMIFIGNGASVRVIGRPRAEPLGLTACELLGANWQHVNSRFQAVLSSGESFHGESVSFFFAREGKSDEVFIDYSLSPIYHEGKVAGILRTLQETTESVLTMRALAESNERLRMALSVGNGFGVWDWHIQTGMVYADETMAKLYGIDPEAAAAGTSHLLYQHMLHPDDLVVLTDAIMECILTGKEYAVDYRVRRADDSYRWIHSMGRCIYDDEGHACRVTGLKTEVAGPTVKEAVSPLRAMFSGGSWDAIPDHVRSFLAATISFLTEKPEDVSLEVIPEPEATRLLLHAAPEDVGRIIGRQGRTIGAVRTLFLTGNATHKQRFTVDVGSRSKPPVV